MNKIHLAATLVLLALSLWGCKRCVTCRSEFVSASAPGDTTIWENESCGSGREVAAWEEEQKDYAEWYYKTAGLIYANCVCWRSE